MTFLLLIGLFFYCIHLSKRIGDLERKASPLENQPTVKQRFTENINPQQSIQQEKRTYTFNTQPTIEQSIFNWLTTNWLLKFGALILLLGIAWFVSYAISENWIGPITRIILGIGFGCVLWAIGHWRGLPAADEIISTTQEQQATAFLAVGTVSIIFSIFAGQTLYGLYPPIVASFAMLVPIIALSVNSVYYRSPNRAVTSLLLAALVPFLTGGESDSSITLLSYGLLISIGTNWIIVKTRWFYLQTVAIALYGFYSLVALSSAPFEQNTAVVVGIYTLFFYITTLASQLFLETTTNTMADKAELIETDTTPHSHNSPANQTSASHSRLSLTLVSLINAFLLIMWIKVLATEQWHYLQPLIYGGLAIANFAIASFAIIHQQTKHNLSKTIDLSAPLFLEYFGVTLILLAAAASSQFSGMIAIISYSAIISLGAVLLHLVFKRTGTAQLLGGLLFPLFLYAHDLWETTKQAQLYSYSRTSVLPSTETIYPDPSHYMTWLVLALQAAGLGYLFYRTTSQDKNKHTETIIASYLISSLYVSLYAIWQLIHGHISQSDKASAIAIMLIASVGFGLYLYGKMQARTKMLYTGISLLGFVIARLLLVEIWSMDVLQRIIVFVSIGLLLLSTGFIKQNNKHAP